MSLESGSMLCRLNHVLLPEPGRPIESTTAPLDFAVADPWAGAGAVAAGSCTSLGASASAASPVGPPGDGNVGAWAGAAGGLPRPRRPRLRERCARGSCWGGSSPSPPAASDANGSSIPPLSSNTSGDASGAASCGKSLVSSRSGKRGCNGSGFSCGGCSVVCCLRRLPRSRIHLRMLHL
jgi:hypothetical protein